MDVCLDQNNELITTDSIARQRTELQVENVNTDEEIDFDDLTITGDYSDNDILEEEKETISLNDEVWVKTKNEIWRGRVILITYSHKKEDSENFKIKWTDSRKEERVIIKNVSLDYTQKRFSLPTQQYYNGAYMDETVHDLTTKTRQRKNQWQLLINMPLRDTSY